MNDRLRLEDKLRDELDAPVVNHGRVAELCGLVAELHQRQSAVTQDAMLPVDVVVDGETDPSSYEPDYSAVTEQERHEQAHADRRALRGY